MGGVGEGRQLHGKHLGQVSPRINRPLSHSWKGSLNYWFGRPWRYVFGLHIVFEFDRPSIGCLCCLVCVLRWREIMVSFQALPSLETLVLLSVGKSV